MPLFDPDLVYPCDSAGVYTTISGKVIEVGDPLDDSTPVKLWTEHGSVTAWTMSKHAPKLGYSAVVRIYRDGICDNQITSWSAPMLLCQACGATTGVAYENARTAYEVPEPTFWDRIRGETPDLPNQPIPLCRPCAKEHHEHWTQMWDEYRSGLL
jgi:hypothetical protein